MFSGVRDEAVSGLSRVKGEQVGAPVAKLDATNNSLDFGGGIGVFTQVCGGRCWGGLIVKFLKVLVDFLTDNL